MSQFHHGQGFMSLSRELVLSERNHDPNGYYEYLGVSSTASKREVFRAFRKRARHVHPDGESPDVDEYHYLQHVFSVLSDDRERFRYDNTPEDHVYLSGWEKSQLRIVPTENSIDTVTQREYYSYYGTESDGMLSEKWHEMIHKASAGLRLSNFGLAFVSGEGIVSDEWEGIPFIFIGRGTKLNTNSITWALLSLSQATHKIRTLQ